MSGQVGIDPMDIGQPGEGEAILEDRVNEGGGIRCTPPFGQTRVKKI